MFPVEMIEKIKNYIPPFRRNFLQMIEVELANFARRNNANVNSSNQYVSYIELRNV